ncbi:GAF domain-containing protein [Natrarchaeobius chitinivorans]|uniref:GAF domain-containing protein n=1 Tax=Natrarchaeobius chitinivorans TaxID=1679083 RepID=A0A3N6M2D2_NATCH|nr:GAF domain-containing protein [Natrarchaeobius chitinivorans]RQG94544.1 GAF domain-containing protein [Natrarchaeobius chitinivorans]
MAHSTPRAHPLLILYVAATDERAQDGALALEEVPTGPDRTVHPTASVDRIREWTPEVDCVVYAGPPETDADSPAEGPTSAKGGDESRLDEVAAACGSTPLVIFADGQDAPPALHSSDCVDGYVRRDADDALEHLVDEITCLCRGDDVQPAGDPFPSGNDHTGIAALETAATIATCRDRDRLFDRLVDGAVDVLGFEYCWIATINFGELVPRAVAPAVPDGALDSTPLDDPLSVAFRARQSIRIADLSTVDAVEAPFEHVRSLCCVPVGDVGVLYVASELPDAFATTDLELLEGLCGTAASILERNWTETGISNERDRLRRERERLVAEYNRLAADRDRMEADRNDLVSLVSSVSEPTIRYGFVDGRPVVRDANEPFVAVFGDDAADLADVPVVEYAVPNGLSEEAKTLREAIQSGEQRHLQCRHETVDGVREFVLTVVPLETGTAESANGGKTAESADELESDGPADALESGGLLVYEDVTESRRRKRALAATRDRLETIAELVDDETRTPLNAARGYLELAEKTGNREHFEMVEQAHDQLSGSLEAVTEVAATGDVETEPIGIREMAHLAWIDAETGDATLATDGDLLLEANRDRLQELFEYVLRVAIEDANATGEPDADPVTVTVGATDDGFYVAGHTPRSNEANDDRRSDPEPGRLVDADGTSTQLELVERIADAHGWDVGVAEDDDGTAFAFRGVDAIDPD